MTMILSCRCGCRYLPKFLKLSFRTHAKISFSKNDKTRKRDIVSFFNKYSTAAIISSSSSAAAAASESDDDVCRLNKRISFLGRHGKVQEARSLFSQMPCRDHVSYASMLTVYLKNHDLPSAEHFFRTIPMRNIVAESAMVHAYASAGRLEEARKLFDEMPGRNVFTWTSLLAGYFHSGLVHEAGSLFQLMPEKNAVSWTTAFLGYAHNGLIDLARTVFDQMPSKNTVAWTAMMKCYADEGRIDEVRQLFYAMPKRNIHSWNIMITACFDDESISDAIQIFDSMPQKNEISWTTMVTGLAQNGFLEQARDYFDRMPRKDIAAWNAMITAYVDQGHMTEATKLFMLMHDRDIVTWNALIDGHARNGTKGEALKHLILMLRSSRLRPDERTITSVLTSCWGLLELKQAHALVVLLGFGFERSLNNALISMYSRTGDLCSASFAFETLEVKDIVSWTTMILAYSYHGYGDHALHAFARMLRSGTQPDEVAFVGILSACSHAGLTEKGQRLFDSMSHVYGLEPKAEHYSCLVDILGRAGRVEEAMEVVSKMPLQKQDAAVLGTLLGACKLHGKVELANCIGQKLLEQEPSNSGGYVLLASAYAAHGKWDEFARIRKMMKQRQVIKEPGFSSIEVEGKNHVFFVGDRSHSQVGNVYKLLQEKLLPIMQMMGTMLYSE